MPEKDKNMDREEFLRMLTGGKPVNFEAGHNLYRHRGDCRGHGLDELWHEIAYLDTLAEQLEQYADQPELLEQKFGEYLERNTENYYNLFYQACQSEKIVIRFEDGSRSPVTKKLTEDLQAIPRDAHCSYHCTVCDAFVPTRHSSVRFD